MTREIGKEFYALRGGQQLLAAMEPDPTDPDTKADSATIANGLQTIMPALLKGEAAAVQLDAKGNVTDTTTSTTK